MLLMALESGTMLGPYEILAPIGAGGLESGHIVLAAEGQLLAARFDLDRLEAASRPVPVHDGILPHRIPGLPISRRPTTETFCI